MGRRGWGAYQGTRHRYLLETALRRLCTSENSNSHCWARWEMEISAALHSCVLQRFQCVAREPSVHNRSYLFHVLCCNFSKISSLLYIFIENLWLWGRPLCGPAQIQNPCRIYLDCSGFSANHAFTIKVLLLRLLTGSRLFFKILDTDLTYYSIGKMLLKAVTPLICVVKFVFMGILSCI